jgi:drug/metabolite transporter (DMT)-like permease
MRSDDPLIGYGALCGLAAAALFGVSAPIAKLLLRDSGPLVLAGLLYLGAGVGVTLARPLIGRLREAVEAPISRPDVPILAGMILAGGVAGPILMLVGLTRVSGMAGSLLLNLEGPLTAVVAVVLFGEHLGKQEAGGATLVFLGAVVLGFGPGPLHADVWGALSIAAACACWAFDNNLTQRLSLRDPVAVVQWKTLGAGVSVSAIAFATGATLPRGIVLAAALVMGALSYGISVLLDLYALRLLGAAREAAFFATAPFIGALVAIPLLGERPSFGGGVAAALMVAGVVVLLRARHGHVHVHEELVHDHLHVHDEHHRHHHEYPVVEPHSHLHRHGPLEHEHPHVSDAHHRHRH